MRGSRVGGSPQACATADRRNRSRACGMRFQGAARVGGPATMWRMQPKRTSRKHCNRVRTGRTGPSIRESAAHLSDRHKSPIANGTRQVEWSPFTSRPGNLSLRKDSPFIFSQQPAKEGYG